MSIEHDYRKPTLASLEEALKRTQDEQAAREQRIANCDMEASDGCLSSWAAGAMEGKRRCQLMLAAAGWKCKLWTLCKLDGTPVKGKIWSGKDKFSFQFVTKWIIDGEWMPSYPGPECISPRKAANLAKRGYKWELVEHDAHVAESFGSYIGAPVSAFPAPDDKEVIWA
jgi:hypothetical protein